MYRLILSYKQILNPTIGINVKVLYLVGGGGQGGGQGGVQGVQGSEGRGRFDDQAGSFQLELPPGTINHHIIIRCGFALENNGLLIDCLSKFFLN